MVFSSQSPQKILIIDDDAQNLKLVIEYLKAYSYTILIARDGQTGLERARQGAPDLILLDVTMPGIDGFEVCRRLSADPATRDIPVIFMSGRTATEDRVRGFEAGAVDYVNKPIEQRELLARARAHLKMREQQGELARYAELLEARISDHVQIVAQEKARSKTLDHELGRLKEMLQEQGDQIQALTRQWLQRRGEAVAGGSPAESPSMALTCAHLKQASALLESQADASEEVEAAQRHVAIALELASTFVEQAEPQPAPSEAPIALDGPDPFEELSEREREIVVMMVSGYANKEIAYKLDIAPTTVSTHRRRIMDRLELHNLPDLVKLAMQHGLMS